MTKHHAVVWMDQHDAKIFRFDNEAFEATSIESPHHHVRRHSSATVEHQHPADAQHYFHDIAVALADVAEILVVGPAKAKLEFIKHVHHHDRALEPKIVGVETVDHPTDGQIVAYARKYFEAVDKKG